MKASFTGVFDGNGYIISHLTINDANYVGLFGQLGDGASVSNLDLKEMDINWTSYGVGGLVGYNGGCITSCYSDGKVSGDWEVGGLAWAMSTSI